MTLDRRQFLQSLVAAAVVAAIPFPAASPELTLTLDEYTERYIKPAMETLAKNFDRDMVRFTQDYDIDRDAMILRADYRVSASEHLQVAVHIDDLEDHELPEIQDMMHQAIEQRINGRQ